MEQAHRFMRQECNCTAMIGLLGCSPNSFNDNGYNVTVAENTVSVSQNDSENQCDNDDDNIPSGRSYPAHCNRVSFFGNGNIGLVVSKENRGLPLQMAEVCDTFTHVPYPSRDNSITSTTHTRLLNFACCLSITLHELTAQIGYNENTFCGTKFSVSLQKPNWNDTSKYESTTGNKNDDTSENEGNLDDSECLPILFANEYD
jgi:hypothetical protein